MVCANQKFATSKDFNCKESISAMGAINSEFVDYFLTITSQTTIYTVITVAGLIELAGFL